jgi:hypothetical protein
VRANAMLGGLHHEYFLGTNRRAAEYLRMTPVRVHNLGKLCSGDFVS